MLSFLRQLADCAEGKRSYIILELADRKKQRDEDGYAISRIWLTHSTRIEELSSTTIGISKVNANGDIVTGNR
jgi:hypothetical protein